MRPIASKMPFIKHASSWQKVVTGEGLREDITKAPLRFWTVQAFPNYLIVYDPASEPLQIIRILHSSRDIQAILVEGGT